MENMTQLNSYLRYVTVSLTLLLISTLTWIYSYFQNNNHLNSWRSIPSVLIAIVVFSFGILALNKIGKQVRRAMDQPPNTNNTIY